MSFSLLSGRIALKLGSFAGYPDMICFIICGSCCNCASMLHSNDISAHGFDKIFLLYCNKVENMILSDINLKWKHNFQSDERQQPSTGAIWMKTGEEN